MGTFAFSAPLGHFINTIVGNLVEFVLREWMNSAGAVGAVRLNRHARDVTTGPSDSMALRPETYGANANVAGSRGPWQRRCDLDEIDPGPTREEPPMNIRHLHEWNLTPAEAREVQDEMAGRLELTPANRLVLDPGDLVMGVDNSYLETAAETTAFAAAVVMTWPDLEIVEVRTATKPIIFPYIPGLLTFRELPVLIEALEQVEREPALIFADGHGVAHPRGIGIAAHLGLLAAMPTIGIAKRPLRMRWTQPGPNVGDTTPIERKGSIVGYAVRTRATRKDPVYVSQGNLIRLEDIVWPVLEASQGAYLPKPQQAAHDEVTRVRRAAKEAAGAA